MVNELLDFHRVEVKSAQLRTTYTSIPEYVSDIYEEFKGWAEASDIHVNLQIDNPEIGMWIDPEHFGKILSNILSNSIRYSHAGSEINIQVAKGYVNDIVPRYKDSFWNTKDMIPGEQAIIRVSDTGIGMEKAVLPTISNVFIRCKIIQVNSIPVRASGYLWSNPLSNSTTAELSSAASRMQEPKLS